MSIVCFRVVKQLEKNVLIIPSAILLILATVIFMPLNDNISNYNLGRLNYRTLK